MAHHVTEGAEHLWALALELLPEGPLGAPLPREDARELQDDASVEEISPRRQLLDAIEDARPLGIEQYFVLVGEEFSCAKSAARTQPTQGIREPWAEVREII